MKYINEKQISVNVKTGAVSINLVKIVLMRIARELGLHAVNALARLACLAC